MIKIYEQTCITWRELVGVRFKLLAIVPTVSLALVATTLSTEGLSEGLSPVGRLLIAIFGLVVTLGLFIYDQRNSVLHDDLISRARKIEDELGVDTGIFRGRLKASCLFKHDLATKLIYGSSICGWLLSIVLVSMQYFSIIQK